MTDRLDERIRGFMVKVMTMVPEDPEYPTDTLIGPVAAHRRVPSWVVAITAGAMVLAAIAIPLVLVSTFQEGRPPTLGGTTTSVALASPDMPLDAAKSMEVQPTTGPAGRVVELSFPEAGLRGVGYRLEARFADGTWQPVAWLVAAAEGYEGVTGSGPWGEDVEFPREQVAGSDPDVVMLPDGMAPGRYRICDALGWTACVELEVSSATAGAETPECLGSAPQRPGNTEIVIYVLCDLNTALPYPLIRLAVDGPSPITSTIMSLIHGTTEGERQAGLSVGFDTVPLEERQEIEVTTDLDDDGVLHVEFLRQDEIWSPGQLASTSSQLLSFIDPVLATAFQFPDVAAIDLSSMCWGETQCDQVLKRSLWEKMVSINSGRSVGEGCGLIGAWLDSECEAP